MVTELQDQEKIFQLLEQNNTLFTDFQSDKFCYFEQNKNAYIVFFLFTKNRLMGFVCDISIDDLKELRNLLQNNEELDKKDKILLPAIQCIENKIAALSISSFFDAH